MTDPVTALSDAHRRVIEFLERHGQEVMEEVPFPPYTVDIYVPRFHAAVEVDGPQHEARRDERRDAVLQSVYYLPVVHVKAEQIRREDELRELLSVFLLACALTVDERRERSKLRLPWL